MSSTSDLLDFFKGLANETRQEILFRVLSDKKPHTVGEVAQSVGIAQSTASEHLAHLKRSGVVLSEKKNREVFYRINKDNISKQISYLSHWLTCC